MNNEKSFELSLLKKSETIYPNSPDLAIIEAFETGSRTGITSLNLIVQNSQVFAR